MGGTLLPVWPGLMVRVRLVARDGNADGATASRAGRLMRGSSTVSLSWRWRRPWWGRFWRTCSESASRPGTERWSCPRLRAPLLLHL